MKVRIRIEIKCGLSADFYIPHFFQSASLLSPALDKHSFFSLGGPITIGKQQKYYRRLELRRTKSQQQMGNEQLHPKSNS